MLLAFLLAQADPAALVERLGSDDIEVRERAAADLGRLGPAAEAVLDAASKDADPEVASRAYGLLMNVVAPHRREVALVVAHVSEHASIAVAGGGSSRMSLWAVVNAMNTLDDSHRLASIAGWGALSEGSVPDLSAASLLRDLRYPPAKVWGAIREKVAGLFDKAYERNCTSCARRRLDTFKLGMSFENARVESILDQLKELGDVRLVMDTMDAQLERAVTVEAKDVTLAEAFERVLAPFELEARVEAGGVILVARR